MSQNYIKNIPFNKTERRPRIWVKKWLYSYFNLRTRWGWGNNATQWPIETMEREVAPFVLWLFGHQCRAVGYGNLISTRFQRQNSPAPMYIKIRIHCALSLYVSQNVKILRQLSRIFSNFVV